MINHKVEFGLHQMDYLGKMEPVLLHKITANPVAGLPSELEAVTLFLFYGPTTEPMHVSNDIRTKAEWQDYGKISLKIPRTNLVHHVGQFLEHPANVRVIENPLMERVASFGEALLQFFNIDVRSLYDTVVGRQHLGKDKSRMEWELAFGGTVDERLRGIKLGDCSHTARRYGAGYLPRGLAQFNRHAGEHAAEYVTGLISGAEGACECLVMAQSYHIPSAVIDEVLRRGPERLQNNDSPIPPISIETAIKTSNINYNIRQQAGHRIVMITKIKGAEEYYVRILPLSMPKFTLLLESYRPQR